MYNFTDYMNTVVYFELGYQRVPQMILKSGLRLSVQASKQCYCSPRSNAPIYDFSYYTEFEIGYPTCLIPELEPYMADSDIFSYVPRAVIQKIIDDNGGIIGFYRYKTRELILAPKMGGVVCYSNWIPIK